MFMSSLTRWSEVRLRSRLATKELVKAGAVLLFKERFDGVEQAVDGFEAGNPGVPLTLGLLVLRKRGVELEVFFAVKPG